MNNFFCKTVPFGFTFSSWHDVLYALVISSTLLGMTVIVNLYASGSSDYSLISIIM